MESRRCDRTKLSHACYDGGSQPLVEETRNQIAVKRGPVVYCVESAGLPKDAKVLNLLLSANAELKPEKVVIANSNLVGLTGKAP